MATTVKTVGLSFVTSVVTNSVKTFQLSKAYVKRFLKIGTLNIIYRRIDISESEFVPATYEDVSYMIFKRKSTDTFIRNYHVFAAGFLDAVEKDFLKDIFMYILDKETNEVLETYNFKIMYNKEATKSNQQPEKVRDATVNFLQSLANIPGKKLNPEKVNLFMEFSYNDETPQSYEPPKFEAATNPLCFNLKFNKKYNFGSINTGYHKISVSGRGQNFVESRSSTPAPTRIEEEELSFDEELQSSNLKKNEIVEISNQRKKQKLDHDGSVNTDILCDNVTITSSEEYNSCVCKLDLPKEFETTRCSKCFGIVHLACHGYILLSAVDENTFKCFHCSDVKPNSSAMNQLSKLRIILFGIYTKKMLPDELEMLSKAERNYILGQLDKLEVYRASKAKSIRDINKKKLNEAMMTVFAMENSQYLE